MWEAASWADEPQPWAAEPSDGSYAEPWARDLGWGFEEGFAARLYARDVAWMAPLAPGERHRWWAWFREPGAYQFVAEYVRERTGAGAVRAAYEDWEEARSDTFVVHE